MSITLARTIEISEDGHVTANPPLSPRNRRATPIFFEIMEEWNKKADIEHVTLPKIDLPPAAKKTTKTKKVSVQGSTPEQGTDKALQETLDAAAAARRIPNRNKQR